MKNLAKEKEELLSILYLFFLGQGIFFLQEQKRESKCLKQRKGKGNLLFLSFSSYLEPSPTEEERENRMKKRRNWDFFFYLRKKDKRERVRKRKEENEEEK